jgi:ATP-dependent DNA ligase
VVFLVELKGSFAKMLIRIWLFSSSAAGKSGFLPVTLLAKAKKCLLNFRKLNLEGMVTKRCNSVYVGGRTRAWLKAKTQAGKRRDA